MAVEVWTSSIDELKKLAAQDDIDAQVQLVKKYAYGLGVTQDANEAAYWYYTARDNPSLSHFPELDNPDGKKIPFGKILESLWPMHEIVESVPFVIHDNELIHVHGKDRVVSVPEGIKSIGKRAFSTLSTDAEEIILPQGVKEIKEFAFSNLKIKKVTLPYGITDIGGSAFSSSSVEHVILPEGITEIKRHTFGDSLRYVTIPTSVRKICAYAFFYCSKLKGVYYQGTKEQWKAIIKEEHNKKLNWVRIYFNHSYDGLPGQRPKDNGILADNKSKKTAVESIESPPPTIPQIGKADMTPNFIPVRQTLTCCIRCGHALSGVRCDMCGHDHTAAKASFLSEVSPDQLQMRDASKVLRESESVLIHPSEEKTLLQRFDEAVERNDEDEAIIYGSDLIQAGEMIHVMLGFKKLANAGFESSEKLYLTLTFRLAYASRKSGQNYGFLWRMTMNELETAIPMAKRIPEEDMALLARKLQCELMCWNAIAATCNSEDLDISQKYKQRAMDLMAAIDVSTADEWAHEYVSFVIEQGL